MRKCTKRIEVRVTEEEHSRIKQYAERCGYKDISSYAREKLLNDKNDSLNKKAIVRELAPLSEEVDELFCYCDLPELKKRIEGRIVSIWQYLNM